MKISNVRDLRVRSVDRRQAEQVRAAHLNGHDDAGFNRNETNRRLYLEGFNPPRELNVIRYGRENIVD